MAKTGEWPEAIIRARGLEAVSDSGELERLARGVIGANAGQLAKYRAGEVKLLYFFVGQVMKSSARAGGGRRIRPSDPARTVPRRRAR
jgi:Asp-tRNA(Asn)/Glu-tRNA(Gln) amidotransferase B subunit